METMAKVDSPMQEPMGDDMAVSVALKTSDFRDAPCTREWAPALCAASGTTRTCSG